MRLLNQLKNHPTSRSLISKYKQQRAVVKLVLQRAKQQILCEIAEEEQSNMIVLAKKCVEIAYFDGNASCQWQRHVAYSTAAYTCI